MRLDVKETEKFATLSEASAWIHQQEQRMFEVMDVHIKNVRRGIQHLFTKDYKPYAVTIKGTVIEPDGE